MPHPPQENKKVEIEAVECLKCQQSAPSYKGIIHDKNCSKPTKQNWEKRTDKKAEEFFEMFGEYFCHLSVVKKNDIHRWLWVTLAHTEEVAKKEERERIKKIIKDKKISNKAVKFFKPELDLLKEIR